MQCDYGKRHGYLDCAGTRIHFDPPRVFDGVRVRELCVFCEDDIERKQKNLAIPVRACLETS